MLDFFMKTLMRNGGQTILPDMTTMCSVSCPDYFKSAMDSRIEHVLIEAEFVKKQLNAVRGDKIFEQHGMPVIAFLYAQEELVQDFLDDSNIIVDQFELCCHASANDLLMAYEDSLKGRTFKSQKDDLSDMPPLVDIPVGHRI